MNVSKAVRLVSLLPVRPVEFYDRVMTVVEVKSERGLEAPPAGNGLSFIDALRLAFDIPASDIQAILAEKPLRQIEEKVREGIRRAKVGGPFDTSHNGDFSLARSIYVICRLMSPDAILETGVAYGVTSALTLQALAVNGKGTLTSIDLPPLGKDADHNVGFLVPEELRERWHLHRGTAKRVLPALLPSLKNVDLFVHDSLHTYRHMTFEFQAVWPFLRPGGILISDDIGLNKAFQDFNSKSNPTFSAVVKEEDKDAQFGILVKGI